MKNWSEEDTVFPVDFPVAPIFRSKNRLNRFSGQVVLLGKALLMTVTIGFAVIGLSAAVAMIGMLIYAWYLSLMQYTLVSVPLTLVAFAVYYTCYRLIK